MANKPKVFKDMSKKTLVSATSAMALTVGLMGLQKAEPVEAAENVCWVWDHETSDFVEGPAEECESGKEESDDDEIEYVEEEIVEEYPEYIPETDGDNSQDDIDNSFPDDDEDDFDDEDVEIIYPGEDGDDIDNEFPEDNDDFDNDDVEIIDPDEDGDDNTESTPETDEDEEVPEETEEDDTESTDSHELVEAKIELKKLIEQYEKVEGSYPLDNHSIFFNKLSKIENTYEDMKTVLEVNQAIKELQETADMYLVDISTIYGPYNTIANLIDVEGLDPKIAEDAWDLLTDIEHFELYFTKDDYEKAMKDMEKMIALIHQDLDSKNEGDQADGEKLVEAQNALSELIKQAQAVAKMAGVDADDAEELLELVDLGEKASESNQLEAIEDIILDLEYTLERTKVNLENTKEQLHELQKEMTTLYQQVSVAQKEVQEVLSQIDRVMQEVNELLNAKLPKAPLAKAFTVADTSHLTKAEFQRLQELQAEYDKLVEAFNQKEQVLNKALSAYTAVVEQVVYSIQGAGHMLSAEELALLIEGIPSIEELEKELASIEQITAELENIEIPEFIPTESGDDNVDEAEDDELKDPSQESGEGENGSNDDQSDDESITSDDNTADDENQNDTDNSTVSSDSSNNNSSNSDNNDEDSVVNDSKTDDEANGTTSTADEKELAIDEEKHIPQAGAETNGIMVAIGSMFLAAAAFLGIRRKEKSEDVL